MYRKILGFGPDSSISNKSPLKNIQELKINNKKNTESVNPFYE